MKVKSYYYFVGVLGLVILVDIFFVGKMIDALTLGIIMIMYIASRGVEGLRKIFFFSAAGCLLLAIILYYFPTAHPIYDIAANWSYAFLAAGAVMMFIEELTNEKNK